MATVDPTTTRAIFGHTRVASGYASARPYLHPQALALLPELIRPMTRAGRALDVGCGTGLSSTALAALVPGVVGVDTSLAMLRAARAAPGVRYVAAEAEALPFASGSFDLVVACGSIDWVDRRRFLPGVAALLAPGGWLVSLDFGDTGRSPDLPALGAWYDDVFVRVCPPPPTADPLIGTGEAVRHGFTGPVTRDFSLTCAFTAPGYAAFLMTESNAVAAVEYGQRTEEALHAWLLAELQPLFEGQAHRVTFAGYIQALRRLTDDEEAARSEAAPPPRGCPSGRLPLHPGGPGGRPS